MVVPPARFARAVPDTWARFHRWCVVHVLGIAVQAGEAPAAGPALYAVKHETMFEAIECPVYLPPPASRSPKPSCSSIPGWGRAARGYGAVPVARDQGAKALRKMIARGANASPPKAARW